MGRPLACFFFMLLLAGCGLFGCSSVPASEEAATPAAELILGGWYFHMGGQTFLLLDLHEDGRFSIQLHSHCKDSTKEAPGGTWSLQGEHFQLDWPDGTSKTQTLLELSPYWLRLGNKKGSEIYLREPVIPDEDRKSRTCGCGKDD